MRHPFLVGEKVYLRGLEETDLDGPYFQWLNDQDSDEFTTHALWPNSRCKMQSFFDKVSDSTRDLVLAIVEKATDRHVGNIGLHEINWIHRKATLAILIGEADSRGKGFGTEAVDLLVAHAFGRLNLHRVELGVRADNMAAIRAYANAGFREEGLFREALLSRGKYFDIVRMARLDRVGIAAREDD
ncbi:MAG: GNAT family N-acetyltransferase [Candidatus Nitricoxidivorans perseverans]|uniref:GNAT family N-acetyltransferase n=1 Tax=Candidatus Nitricoxidivorans perseverans TaxID=2975601 RepID=A0AA49IY57_9PROT|nr:MAG: GNAT family N-acetyltransferase [Candidatus Nitricoxidivorans perseverans]